MLFGTHAVEQQSNPFHFILTNDMDQNTVLSNDIWKENFIGSELDIEIYFVQTIEKGNVFFIKGVNYQEHAFDTRFKKAFDIDFFYYGNIANLVELNGIREYEHTCREGFVILDIDISEFKKIYPIK